MGCTIGAIIGIAIGDNVSPLGPFFVAIGANSEMSNSLGHFYLRKLFKTRLIVVLFTGNWEISYGPYGACIGPIWGLYEANIPPVYRQYEADTPPIAGQFLFKLLLKTTG